MSPGPRLPRDRLWALSLDLLRRRRRSLRSDSEAVVRRLSGRWRAEGIEYIPLDGAVCLVANHWQRPGLWIGWGGALLGSLVAQRRPRADPPVRWLVLAELHVPLFGRERHLAPLDLVLARVAWTWGMAPLSFAGGAAAGRATALRALARPVQRGEVVGFFPEGHRGCAGPLGSAVPGAGRAVAWLAHRGARVLPAALFEEDGRLVARFGPLVPAAEVEAQLMPSIARLLPATLRGGWDSPGEPPAC